MKLILVRHGETEENFTDTLQGQLPGKLSEKGRRQAQQVAKRFKDEHIDTIYTSDLKRAIDTAEEIAKIHPGTPVVKEPLLRERNLSIFQGRPCEEFKKHALQKNYDIHAHRPPGGENLDDVRARVVHFYHTVLEHEHGTILIVTHGGPFTALLLHLLNLPNDRFGDYHPKNTAVTIVEVDENKQHKIHLLNCTEHLSE